VKLGDILPKIAWDGKKNQKYFRKRFFVSKKNRTFAGRIMNVA